MRPLRTLYVGDLASGRALLDRIAAGHGAELAVLAATGTRAVRMAGSTGALHVEPEALNLPDTVAALAALDLDLLVNFNATVVFGAPLLACFRLAALNFHPGPLPGYAGVNVHQWAIANGETEFAVTIHRIEVTIDTGPVLRSRAVPIADTDTGLSLYLRLLQAGAQEMMTTVEAAIAGDPLEGIPQEPSGRHYYGRRDRLDGTIDFRAPARQVANLIRALSYRPFASPMGRPVTAWRDLPLEVDRAIVASDAMSTSAAAPGTVLAIDDGGLMVRTGDGAVAITNLVLAGQTTPATQAAITLGLGVGTHLGG